MTALDIAFYAVLLAVGIVIGVQLATWRDAECSACSTRREIEADRLRYIERQTHWVTPYGDRGCDGGPLVGLHSSTVSSVTCCNCVDAYRRAVVIAQGLRGVVDVTNRVS